MQTDACIKGNNRDDQESAARREPRPPGDLVFNRLLIAANDGIAEGADSCDLNVNDIAVF